MKLDVSFIIAPEMVWMDFKHGSTTKEYAQFSILDRIGIRNTILCMRGHAWYCICRRSGSIYVLHLQCAVRQVCMSLQMTHFSINLCWQFPRYWSALTPWWYFFSVLGGHKCTNAIRIVMDVHVCRLPSLSRPGIRWHLIWRIWIHGEQWCKGSYHSNCSFSVCLRNLILFIELFFSSVQQHGNSPRCLLAKITPGRKRKEGIQKECKNK